MFKRLIAFSVLAATTAQAEQLVSEKPIVFCANRQHQTLQVDKLTLKEFDERLADYYQYTEYRVSYSSPTEKVVRQVREAALTTSDSRVVFSWSEGDEFVYLYAKGIDTLLDMNLKSSGAVQTTVSTVSPLRDLACSQQ